jgi:hypothetical protein
MRPLLILALLTVLVGLAVWVPTSCGAPSGAAQPTVTEQRVTRDHGAELIRQTRHPELEPGETVLELLQRDLAVGTGSGGSVTSIEGHAAGRRDGRPHDWAYYVNGIRAAAPAAETRVNAGERIWWDLNGDVGGVEPPAVVGSFPEPFLSGVGGKRRPVRIDCSEGSARLCDEVTTRLDQAGVSAVARSALNGPAGSELLRIVVGPWPEIRRDPTVRPLERGLQDSGVFAQFRAGGRRLALLDDRGRVVRTLGAGTGLVAALRFEGQQPAWVVTGTDAAGAAAAATALRDETLRRRFAVAIVRGRPVALPLAATLGD